MLKMFYDTGAGNSRNKDFQLWQQHNRPIELCSNNLMNRLLNYTYNNPVVAGFVKKPEDWL